MAEGSSANGSTNKPLVRRNFTTTMRRQEILYRLSSDEEEDVQFDTTDTDDSYEVLTAGKQSIQEFASAIPDHLLLGSLLEHLCCMYENDPTRSSMLFKVIGQRLAAMNLLSPLAISDEFSTVRLQHNRAFTELLNAASSSLFPQGQQILSTDSQSLMLRPKAGLFQAQTSRYLSEFEEVCRLGKGAYGNVFKVINKLDGQNYAVKKILIKNVSRDDCMRVLREVKVLSSLQHENVVGYHTAWMEHVQPATAHSQAPLPAIESPEVGDGVEESLKDGSSGSSIVFQSSSQMEPSPVPSTPVSSQLVKASVFSQARGLSAVVCPQMIQHIPDSYVPCVFLGHRESMQRMSCPVMSCDGSGLSEEGEANRRRAQLSNDSDIRRPPDKHRATRPEMQFQLMLYIQMQLCERSLKDWISERNNRLAEKKDLASKCPYSTVDVEHTLHLLRKVLEGVEYIHSRGIMHRDLKPTNIFLLGHDSHVRIGDFGLACRDIIVDNQGPLASTSDNTGSSHTTGVGTLLYAAPEQLDGSHYDSKSDMYSLGVLALELFQPFGTEMERVEILRGLREGRVPDSFCRLWPVLAEHVTQLISAEPAQRPSASRLLQSPLFCCTDLVIGCLQRKVVEQQEEIVQLRRQISQLQNTQNPASPSD